MDNFRENSQRFTGFAEVYDDARPSVPQLACEIIERYLGNRPETVVDLGCGTGLSTLAWQGRCKSVIGIEPSEDMLRIARLKEGGSVRFIKAFSDDIPLADSSADVVACSQSFHWMEPQATLAQSARILKSPGVFATIDCSWPPVCSLKSEKAYNELRLAVEKAEQSGNGVRSFISRDKSTHLSVIAASGRFSYCREVLLASSERCSADRFIGIALSQGGLQTVLKHDPSLIQDDIIRFKRSVEDDFCGEDRTIYFSYTVRLGVKE